MLPKFNFGTAGIFFGPENVKGQQPSHISLLVVDYNLVSSPFLLVMLVGFLTHPTDAMVVGRELSSQRRPRGREFSYRESESIVSRRRRCSA